MPRSITLGLILLLAIAVTPLRAQTAPAGAVASPFDQEDPEIAAIQKLDWQHASFTALDPKNQCAALMALNNALSRIGAKANARLELLIDYLDEKDLGKAYAESRAEIPSPTKVTFDDMTRVAAAFVVTPQGAQRLADEVSGLTGDLLSRYTGLYDKSARRLFDEALDARQQVRSMGLFLQKQGKLDDFRDWSIAAQTQRAEQEQKEMQEQQAKDQQARQERAQAYAAQKQQEQQARQMEAALQAQQQSTDSSQSSSSNDDAGWAYSSGWPAYGYGYGYYSSNAYRGYVQDKYRNAYDRWSNRPRPTPLPARPSGIGRGGGLRMGGRR